MTPTKDPLTELAARLAAVGGPDALAVRDGLARHPDQAHLAIRSAVLAAAARRDEEAPTPGDSDARLVLIVDQFEQVFTLNPDLGGEDTRQAFITALCSAAENPAGPGQVPPALVVIAVRGDFWDRCAAVPELVGALQDGQFVVGPMTESELRVAITGPAEAARLRIDPGLTETILGDLRVAGGDRSAGVLPLLSQAMALTWEHREGDRLTSRGYAQAGGVSHAVQTGADRAYDALPAGLQALAPDVLRSMTVASRDGGHARRPVTRATCIPGCRGRPGLTSTPCWTRLPPSGWPSWMRIGRSYRMMCCCGPGPGCAGGWRRTRPAGSCTASLRTPPPPGTTAATTRPSCTGELS